MKKQKIILVQLGSPKTPSVKDVRAFLKEFLSDPRVLDINPFLRKIILNLFILPFRPSKSAELYKRIWDGKSFPLIENTKILSKKLNEKFSGDNIEVDHVFLLSEPRFKTVWDKWEKEDPRYRSERWLIVPLFPQYSAATTASVMDIFFNELKKRTQIPAFEFIESFHKSPAFVDSYKKQIENHIGSIKDLVVSFHGLPKRRIIIDKDPYYEQCFETYKLITENLNLNTYFSFQSRFGREEWLTPTTEEKVLELINQNKKEISICCPSFVSDCLETTDEIGHELKKLVERKNAKLNVIPCLNYEEFWIEKFYDYLKSKAYGIKPKTYQVPEEIMKTIPEQKLQSYPLSPIAKKSLKVVFLTLFLDLVGFSIIFPLFPAMAKWYMEVDSGNYFLNLIFSGINKVAVTNGEQIFSSLVLFGGVLGALYSFLQFIAAPFWGSLSDKIGRKPVLLISISWLAFSYLLWFFSGSFTLLILSRFLAGIMGGNISTATAVVADVTDNNNRSKGMAIIGIAFALGFILGPAIGGIFSKIDLTKINPQWVEYGVNPFSFPALFAFMLSCLNIFLLVRNFKETLPVEKRGIKKGERTSNIFQLFRPLPFKGVNLTNFSNLLFISIFSGMEFTLTFLAFERLGYGPMENAYLFVFIGVILALVQGGYVRRVAHKIGEKKLVLRGLFLLVPGLVLIGSTHSPLVLYIGSFFLAVGSAIIVPCLTSLVSLYTPHDSQGRSIGIFRSMGALGRVVGPIFASLVYWKWGSAYPYFAGSILLLLPFLLVWFLPKIPKEV